MLAHPASRSRRSGSGSNDRVSGSTSGPERSSAILIEPGSSGLGSAYGPFVDPSPSLGSPRVDTPDQSMIVGNGCGVSRQPAVRHLLERRHQREVDAGRPQQRPGPRAGRHDRHGSRERVAAVGRDLARRRLAGRSSRTTRLLAHRRAGLRRHPGLRANGPLGHAHAALLLEQHRRAGRDHESGPALHRRLRGEPRERRAGGLERVGGPPPSFADVDAAGRVQQALARRVLQLAPGVERRAGHPHVVGVLVREAEDARRPAGRTAGVAEREPFEQEGVPASPGELVRGRRSHDAAADDDRVEHLAHVVTATDPWRGSLPGDRHAPDARRRRASAGRQ